jgi:sec-independent protein translocase protein TatB
MFDIGFSEIVVIGVVALVVIGPERLPKTARTVGLLFGRLQRYVNDVKADISREMELDELRRLKSEMQGANDMAAGVRSVESELNAAATQATDTGGTAVASSALPAPPAGTEASPPRQAPLPGFDKI